MRVIASVILVLNVVPTFAQTASEVQRSYGKPIFVNSGVSVYSVSEHIWMTPTYSLDGQVCRIRLYPRTDYRGSQFLFPELVRVINRMVPPHLRGSKKDDFGVSTLGGGTAQTIYEYENVSFNFISFYKLDPDVLRKAEAFVLTGIDPEKLPEREKSPPSFDDFAASKDLPTEIVILSWNHRQCKTLNSRK